MRKSGLNQPLHQLGYRLLAQPCSEALDILYVLDHERFKSSHLPGEPIPGITDWPSSDAK
jgi:hypothetical protein